MLSHRKSIINCSAGVELSSWGSTDCRHSFVIFLCTPTVGYSGHVCSEQNFSPVSPLCCPRTLWQRASCCLISRPVTTAHGGVHNQQWERSQCSSFVRPLSLFHWFPTHSRGTGCNVMIDSWALDWQIQLSPRQLFEIWHLDSVSLLSPYTRGAHIQSSRATDEPSFLSYQAEITSFSILPGEHCFHLGSRIPWRKPFLTGRTKTRLDCSPRQLELAPLGKKGWHHTHTAGTVIHKTHTYKS